MSNIFQNIGLTLGLLSAPALAYAESGTFVPAGSDIASTPATDAPKKVMRKKYSQAAESPAKIEQESFNRVLKIRIDQLQERNEEQDRNLQKAVGDYQRSAERSEDRDVSLGRRLGLVEEGVNRVSKDVSDLSSDVQRVDAQSRRFAMEAGAHYTRTDDTNRVSVQAALCYLGNKVTFCAGSGVGKASESTTVADLTTPATYEQNGKYTEAALQTGTETSGNRYQWNASARFAPAHGSRVGRRGEVIPHLTLDVLFNKERVTTNLTRTTQLYHDNQTVGNPVTASGSETEYSTGKALVPSVGFDACRAVGSRNSGEALCARLGLGYDAQNETGLLSLGALARF